ncbi:MAG: response regulator [Thermoleophilia bacterium]
MTTGATPHGVSTPNFPPGTDRVAEVIASRDWASTPLGPREDWPAELRSLLRVLLTSRFSMWLGWGPDLAFFYNDAYRRDTLGTKHPWALGRPAREVWAEAWDDLAPRIEQVMAEGRSTWDQALELRLERGDSPEETYHTFSYSPITGDDGAVLGLFCVVTEETHRVIGARRMATLRRLGGDLAMQLEEDEMLRALGGSLASNTRDLPFTCVYVSEADGVARLAGTSGITPGAPGAPEVIAGDAPAWPLPSGGGPLVVDDLRDRFGDLPTGEWDRPPSRAVVVPLVMRAGDPPLGWFVAGMNPLRPLDQEALGWVELVAGRIAGSLATVRAYAGERRRAEALAELDRAKTTFFSDISHELRTPLTLMSGPLQQATQRPELPDDLREQLGFAYRGSGRLLKLVNTLLEFARIEAGRVDARFEPIELAAFTEDIASAFRSGAETMGLRMTVACAPLGEPVFVDPEMWEKIVSNLLSNALKFTHEGEVHVALALEDADAVLRVRDTGIGIAPDDLPELFRRFHRVRGAEGRTHEGSGIGLALVSELAQLHGGRAGVRSRPGAGSEFEVRIPRGRAHIPDEHLAAAPAMRDGVTTQQFVQEVLSWADDPDPAPEFPGMPVADARAAASGRILVADDNADMRAYLTRLLGSHYEVRALANGHDVLRAAMDDPPDLIVSDVMMPRVDGLEMVRRLRANPRTARIPVMLLSARAGVEASEEGLDSGADDYLLKPFSARELLARVGAHMALGRARREAEDQERAARERIEDLQARTARDEQRLRLLATASTTCLWGTDAAGVVTEPSPSWEEFTGQATSEYLGPDRGWLDAFDGPDRERLTHWFTGPARPRDAVARLRHADGTHRRVRLHAVPVTAEGAVGEWIASATDVEDELLLREEHERQHLELRVAQAQIAQATAAGRVGVWTWEMAGDHITADPVFAQILGLEAGGAGPVATSVVGCWRPCTGGPRRRAPRAAGIGAHRHRPRGGVPGARCPW